MRDFEKALALAAASPRAESGIGSVSEGSLHHFLKFYFEPDADLHEVGVGRYFADIRNEDASGTVAAVTSILSQLRVNVANMSLYRHKRGGDALMVIETDQHLKPHQVAFLSELPGILSITYYDKEEDEDVSGFDEGDL